MIGFAGFLFSRIHIMGSYANIAIARNAICNLIMGSPPSKVYNQMKQVAARPPPSKVYNQMKQVAARQRERF